MALAMPTAHSLLQSMAGGLAIGLLARLEPLLIKVLESQAEMRGEMRGQFDQMGQRISGINARLPVPIGYSPPKSSAA